MCHPVDREIFFKSPVPLVYELLPRTANPATAATATERLVLALARQASSQKHQGVEVPTSQVLYYISCLLLRIIFTEMRLNLCRSCLSRAQAGPGRTFKQESEEISPKHVQRLNLIPVLCQTNKRGERLIPRHPSTDCAG